MGQLFVVEFTEAGATSMTNPEESREDIPINLRFELAQWQASLADISQLAPGSVVDLGRPIDSQTISVWVEQRCIGNGQLVAVGDRLGVRLLEVFAAGQGG
jgi:type III secretion protein Q